jgi:K319-like protein/FG-GAP repeat protein
MASQGWFPTPARHCSLLVILLLVGCGGGGDSGSGGGPAAPAPTAQAIADQTVPVGTPTTLDGSGSESPTGTPLSYQWTLTAKPSGSAASLTNPLSVKSTFTPDMAGSYTATLVVRANGVDSAPAAVSVTAVTGNVAPVANAGPDRNAAPSRPITLDGTASHDPNKTTITYTWRIVEQPPGSHPTLTNATSATPTFTADVAGRYVLALTCSDGSMTSIIDQVVIIVATGNLPPVANAGPDQTVTAGQQVTLDGTRSSDPNGDPLTYSWCLKGRPVGSTATLSGANTAHPTFTPDVAGSYLFCLTVNDGTLGSDSDSVVIEARLPSSVNGVLQAYIKASNTTYPQFRSFGQSVALEGNTLAVGAVDPSCATGINGNQSNSDCPGAGAVYVFTRTDSTWSQQAYLKASNANAGDEFGGSVSLSGDTLVVGAVEEDSCARGINGDQTSNTCQQSGAVYVFTRTGSTWSQQAYVKPSNTDPSNAMFFGTTVSLSGNTLAVGAWLERSCATGINGNQVDTGCVQSGAAYIFTRNDNVWTQQAYVKASNTRSLDGFGITVALDDNTLAVGATGEGGAGAVYVFTRTAGVWTQQAYVKGSNSSPGDEFGLGLALKDDTLIVGARFEDSCATGINGNQADDGCLEEGAVYIFSRTNNLWSQVAYVKRIAPGPQPASNFGSTLAFDGTTLAVSDFDSNCARGFNPSPGTNDCGHSGAVYLFTRTENSWAQRGYVKASNTDYFDWFGNGLAIGGNTLVAGAPYEDSCATGVNGSQSNNSCGPPPDSTPGDNNFPPPTFGAGAVYVYVMQ